MNHQIRSSRSWRVRSSRASFWGPAWLSPGRPHHNDGPREDGASCSRSSHTPRSEPLRDPPSSGRRSNVSDPVVAARGFQESWTARPRPGRTASLCVPCSSRNRGWAWGGFRRIFDTCCRGIPYGCVRVAILLYKGGKFRGVLWVIFL